VLLSLSPACTCLSCERCATTNTPESLGRRLIPPATPGTTSGFRRRRRNGENTKSSINKNRNGHCYEKRRPSGWTCRRLPSIQTCSLGRRKSRGSVPGEGGRVAPGVVPPHGALPMQGGEGAEVPLPTQQPPPRRNQQQPRWSHKRKLRCVIIVVSCLE
jgi:hypothetical protein